MRLAELVDRARDGDVEAFGDLYDEYALTVYRSIHERVYSGELAERFTCETFISAAKGLSAWHGQDFTAWLETIARSLMVDYFVRPAKSSSSGDEGDGA